MSSDETKKKAREKSSVASGASSDKPSAPEITFSRQEPTRISFTLDTDAPSGSPLSAVFGPSGSRPMVDLLSGVSRGSEISQLLLASPREQDLQREIAELRTAVTKQQRELTKKERTEKEVAALKAAISQLQEKSRLEFVLSRIGSEAKKAVLESEELRNLFLQQSTCSAFVVSVDIRRSTELMLKARSPQLFAEFITALCSNLCAIVLANNGVFDKFTGDGVLAFFPDF